MLVLATLALFGAETYQKPPKAELAEPMFRIAGLRINPKTNGLHRPTVIAGKETIEHVLWEKFAWFDKYVKNAGPPPAAVPTNNNNDNR